MAKKNEKNVVALGLAVICVIMLIGFIFVGMKYVSTSAELNSVPCWTEPCIDKSVDNSEYILNIAKVYRYKSEQVSIGSMTWNEPNILPISAIKKIIDPKVRLLIEEDNSFGIKQTYAELGMYDSDGSELYIAKQGTKPEWLEE